MWILRKDQIACVDVCKAGGRLKLTTEPYELGVKPQEQKILLRGELSGIAPQDQFVESVVKDEEYGI